ncbi:MAG: Gfo/Idh/MocA family oxidoreductase [Planctomycetota bacterium]
MNPRDRRTFLKGAAGAAAVIALQPEGLAAAPPRLSAPLRMGLVGTGRQGRAILGELAKFEDVQLIAICDSDARRLQGAKRRAPQAASFDSHERMLDEAQGLDAVVVATPSHQHKAVTLDAISAGVHVYCEGPLASTMADARAIARAARGSQAVFQTGMQGRSNPVYGLARSFARTGAIRDIIGMRAQHHRKISWRTPSQDPARDKFLNWRLDPEISLGLIGEIGVHQFDVLHWFTGQYPTAVRATGAVLAWKDGRSEPDTVRCNLTFPGGVHLDWDATLGNSYGGQYEVLNGTMGSMKLAWTHGWMFKEADATTFEWEVYATRQQFHKDEGIILIADATKLAAQGKLKEGIGLPHPPLYYALEEFVLSISEGTKIACSAEEGVRATAVAVRARQAMWSGEEVAITEADLEVG